MSARGVPEYEFNLQLANRIAKDLAAAGFRQANVLVTPGPAKRSLLMRVAHAANLTAELFISIHHDSVPERFLKTWEHEGKQLRYSDYFRGHSIFMFYENAHAAASFQFAQLLGSELKRRGLQYTPHYAQAFMQERQRDRLDPGAGVYRFDQLIVLKDTRTPAVLLEAGSIINRDEEVLMSDPKHQAVIGAAVDRCGRAVLRGAGGLAPGTHLRPMRVKRSVKAQGFRPVPQRRVPALPIISRWLRPECDDGAS